MKRFMLGALSGAALTALGFWLFSPAAPAPRFNGVDRVPAASAPEPDRQAERQADPRPPADRPPPEPAWRASGAMPPPPPPPNAPPPGAAFAEPPPAAPRLSSEHAELLKPKPRDGRPLTLPELHLQLSSERPDPNWSSGMEQTLRQYIAQANGSGEFELLNVECRATLCEITLFGNLPASGQRWNGLLAEMGNQPWGTQFQGQSTSTSGVNGRATIVSILQRAKR